MSFLEDMAGKEVSGMLANSSNPLASSVMQMINSQPGGLSGLLQQFHDKGSGRPGFLMGQHRPEPSHFRRSDSACFGQRTGEGTRGQSRNFTRCRQLSSVTVVACAG